MVQVCLRRPWRSLAARTGGRPLGRGPTAYLVVVSALAAALVLARMSTWGVGWERDSAHYLAAARTLLAGEGLQEVRDAPFTWWPPLYPLLLAAGGIFVDPLEVPGPLNLVAFALTIFCFGRYLWARLDSIFLRVWIPLACALSLPLAEGARWAMTETPFILLTTLALMSVDEYRANGSSKAFLFTAVLSALAWQTRYMGVALVVTAGLLILFDGRRLVPERVKRLAVFGAIASAPMALWVLRNYGFAGRPIPSIVPQDYSWRGLFEDLVGHLWSWADFDRGPSTLVFVLLLALVAALARGRLAAIGQRTGRSASSASNLVTVWGFFGLAYLACLMASLMMGASWSGVQARYVTPLYIPALAVLAGLLDRFLVRERARRRSISRLLSPVSMICLSAWLVGQGAPTVRAITRANSEDFSNRNGLAAARWTRSETLDALVRLQSLGIRPTATNDADAVSLHTGARGLRDLPTNREIAVNSDFTEWLDRLPDGTRIVWFRRWDAEREHFVPTPLALRFTPGLVPVGEFGDGAILEVDRSSSPEVPPAARFDLRAVAPPGALIAGDVFDVYLDGNEIRYFREPCAARDVEARFFLHFYGPPTELTPGSPADAARKRKFENRDFSFFEYGAILDGRCLAMAPAADPGAFRISTGQFAPGEPPTWSVDLWPGKRLLESRLESISSGGLGEPKARSAFDIYLEDSAVVFHRASCASSDLEARFFLRFGPARGTDPPLDPAGRGLLERDFDFTDFGFLSDGQCLARAPLPDSVGGRLRAGQFSPDGESLWSVEVALSPGR